MQTTLALLLALLPSMSDELVTGVEPMKDAVVVQVAGGGCVDGPGLAQQVEARAGPGSVVDVGRRTVDVAFSGTAPAVFVGVTLDVDGQRAGGRRLGPFAGCAAAVDAAALAIALVIDPFAAPVALPSSPEPEPEPPPEPTPPSEPPPEPTTTTTLTTTPPAVEIVRPPALAPPFSVGVGAAVGVGSGFGVVPGPMGLVRLRLDAGVIPVVVALGGRVDVPAPLVIDGRRRLETVGGAFFVEGCHRLAPSPSTLLDSCALVEAGGLRGTGVGFDNAVPTTARLIGLGAAVTLRTALGAGPGVFARVVVAAPVLRARLVADGVAHWESPPVTGLLVVGLDGLVSP